MRYGKETKERTKDEIHPTRQWKKITQWITMWPFSFISNFSRDVIQAVEDVVKRFFRGIYNRIYNSAVSKLD